MGGTPLLVLFTAPAWCAPCRKFEPHWKSLITASEAGFKNLRFAVVDLGDSPEDTMKHWATEAYQVMSVPSLKLFFDVDDYVDVRSRAIVPLLKELEGLNGQV